MLEDNFELALPAGSRKDPAMLRKTLEIFFVFLKLGLTSFGGPIAHLGYFHDEFVKKRKWLSEQDFVDLVALCQFLPGPASSQVGMAIGISRAGLPGSIAAWLGFTLPSALALVSLALGFQFFNQQLNSLSLQGLKIAALAVVAQAIWGMGIKLCPDIRRASIALTAALSSFFLASMTGAPVITQVVVIFFSGFLGLIFLENTADLAHKAVSYNISRRTGVLFLSCFAILLILLPLLSYGIQSEGLQMFESFFRAGALVFGGGHVVLPLLQAEVVPRGWISSDQFMLGYGAAQAIPGPLFSFAAFLGAAAVPQPYSLLGAGLCLIAIFLPSFLLVIGVLPFWENLREQKKTRRAMFGMNAGVVGILITAFYNPIWKSSIHNLQELALAAFSLALLTLGKAPSWSVVIFCLVIGTVL